MGENFEEELGIERLSDTQDIIMEESIIIKKKPKVKKIVIWLVVIFAFLLAVFLALDILNDIYGFLKPYKVTEITISKDELSDKSIINILNKNKIIRYPFVLQMYFNRVKATGGFYSGTFTLNKDFSYSQILKALLLKNKPIEVVKITLPEGYTQTQIVDTIVAKGATTKDKLVEVFETGTFQYPFLKDLPQRESRFEGYLFPDTYEVYKNEDGFSIIKRLFDNFSKKIKDNHIEEKAKQSNLTLDQAVILASIIERETLKKDDLATVSSVFHNRLKKGMKLQSCVTVLYALGSHKSFVTIADTKIESPYNTYYVNGLPKGPVCNPGIAAMKAAVEPAKSDYYYFYSTTNGKIYFSKTYAEHLAIIKKYKGGTGTDAAE